MNPDRQRRPFPEYPLHRHAAVQHFLQYVAQIEMAVPLGSSMLGVACSYAFATSGFAKKFHKARRQGAFQVFFSSPDDFRRQVAMIGSCALDIGEGSQGLVFGPLEHGAAHQRHLNWRTNSSR